jgi:hypothetical protein
MLRRSSDTLSLLVSLDLIAVISHFFDKIQGALEEASPTAQTLENCLHFLNATARLLTLRDNNCQLPLAVKETNLVNIVSMLYGMLHKEASTPIKYLADGAAAQTRKQQASSTLRLSTLSLRLLNQMAALDLAMMQSLLGAESNSLQLRHIASYLIWYLTTNRHDELLHEIVLLIGYFSLLNCENQVSWSVACWLPG